MLDGYSDPVVRSSVEDYILNRGLRCDVYVKSHTAAPFTTAIASQPMWLTSPDGRINQTVTAPNGKKISLQSPLFDGIVAELRLGIRSGVELHAKPALSSWSESEIVDAITRLVASGQVKPVIGNALVPAETVSPKDCRPVLAITRELLRGHIPAAGFINLPSPLLGQCVPVDRLIGLSLSALLYQPAGNEANWIADQIGTEGITGIQGVATEVTREQAADLARQVLQMTRTSVLPAMVRLGVYEYINRIDKP